MIPYSKSTTDCMKIAVLHLCVHIQWQKLFRPIELLEKTGNCSFVQNYWTHRKYIVIINTAEYTGNERLSELQQIQQKCLGVFCARMYKKISYTAHTVGVVQ